VGCGLWKPPRAPGRLVLPWPAAEWLRADHVLGGGVGNL